LLQGFRYRPQPKYQPVPVLSKHIYSIIYNIAMISRLENDGTFLTGTGTEIKENTIYIFRFIETFHTSLGKIPLLILQTNPKTDKNLRDVHKKKNNGCKNITSYKKSLQKNLQKKITSSLIKDVADITLS
jgi:hypothetical protein